jgi:molecular chaperone DnaK (HSP70)
MAEKGLAYDQLSPENKADLYMKAKEIKERLSGVQTIRVPFTFCMPPFMYPMEQKKLESISAGFIEKTKELILDSLKNAYQAPLSPSDIDQVILEGGASTMPWVKRLLGEILGDSDKIYVSDKPALDISMGACYYAAMKLGVLDHPEMTTIRKNIDFEVSLAHDIGFEIEVNNKTSFYPLLHRGTPYQLAKRSQTFTLSGQDMTSFDLKILERVKPEDRIDQCRQVGQVVFRNLPERPSGKTQLRVTLTVHDQVGMVSGAVYDLGYQAAYPGLGLIGSFTPKRQETITIINEKKE